MARNTSSKASAKKYSAAPVTTKPAAAIEAVVKEVKTPAPAPVAVAAPAPAATATAAPVIVAAKPVEAKKTEVKPAADNLPEVKELLVTLQNGDADVARDAAIKLGTLANAAAVEPLIEVIENNGGYFHAVVRAAAASSLAQLGDRRAVEALIGAVRDEQAEPSAEAIRALATIGDTRAVSALIEVVRNPSGFFLPVARLAAVSALGHLKDEQAAAELRAVAGDTWEDNVIREAAQNSVR